MTSSLATGVERIERCPLCGSAQARTLPVPGRWVGAGFFSPLEGALGLARCRSCRLVFANPRPDPATLEAFYGRDDYEFHDGAATAATGARADFFLERIERVLPATAPRTLLDFGTGGGGFLRHAQARGWRVKGFEPAARGLASCRAAGLDVTDRLEALPRGEFGLIVLHHVLEHLARPAETLRQLEPLLAPQGRIYVEVPNARSLRARLALPWLSRRFAIDERYRAFPIHLLYFSPQTLRQQLASAGWSVDTMFTIGLGLDELVVRESSPTSVPAARGSRAPSPAARTRPRRLRHKVRDAFLDACLGENLGAVAHRVDG